MIEQILVKHLKNIYKQLKIKEKTKFPNNYLNLFRLLKNVLPLDKENEIFYNLVAKQTGEIVNYIINNVNF